MMQNRWLYSLFACLVFGGFAAASETRGVIIKADPTKGELVIEGRGVGKRGSVLTLVVNQETQILVERKTASLTDLTPGKRVRVVYEAKNGQLIARLVSVNPLLPLVREALPLIQQGAQQLGLDVQVGPMPQQALPNPQQGNPPPVAAPAGTFQGTLRRVSPSDREIVIVEAAGRAGPSRELTLVVPDDTQITRNGKAFTFDDLHEGESVSVTFEDAGGKRLTKTIQVGTVVPPDPSPVRPGTGR